MVVCTQPEAAPLDFDDAVGARLTESMYVVGNLQERVRCNPGSQPNGGYTVAIHARRNAKVGVLLLAAMLVAACGVRGGGAADTAEGEYTIRVAHELTPQSVKGLTMERFKQIVEEKTGGKVEVEIYPNSELYGGAQAIQAVQNGSVEMTVGASGDFVNIAPSLQVMDLPFIIEDYDELQGVTAADTKVGDLVRNNPELGANNIQVLTVFGSGIKQISSNVRTASLEDLSGQRIRTQQSPIEIEIFKALGANPVPMEDFSQVYTALQQGVVDGQTNPYSTILSESVFEVQDYIADVDMGYTAYLIIIADDFFEGLPEDIKSDLQDAAAETQTYSLQLQEEENSMAKEQIAASGTEIIEFSEAERLKFKQALIPDVYNMFADEIGQDIVDELVAKEQSEMQ